MSELRPDLDQVWPRRPAVDGPVMYGAGGTIRFETADGVEMLAKVDREENRVEWQGPPHVRPPNPEIGDRWRSPDWPTRRWDGDDWVIVDL